MAQKLTVGMTGDITLQRNNAVCGGGAQDGGESFYLSLLDINRQADLEISQKLAVVDATGGPVALPFPTNLDGRFFYLKILSGSALEVSIDFATQGPTALPVKHMILIEPADGDSIQGITINSGDASFEWLVTGVEK